MRSSNATKLLCLLLVMALVIGLMIGCRQAQNTGSTTTSPTDSTEPSTRFQVGPYQPDPSIADITLVINEFSDNAYYPVSSLWSMNKVSLPDAWDISTGSSTVWTSVNGVIHSRTCTTCGYTQTGRHSDSWDALFSRCIVCRYKGIAVAPIENIPPAEDSAA